MECCRFGKRRVFLPVEGRLIYRNEETRPVEITGNCNYPFDPKREMLRHTVATLAYRGGKILRDAPEGFASFRIGETTRTPAQILAQ